MDSINPDCRPAEDGYYVEERASGAVIATLRVRGHGALVITGNADDVSHGVALFTDEDILFDPT